MIKIDLEKTYSAIKSEIDKKLSVIEFYSQQANGDPILIRLTIKPHWGKLLPAVYNLAMGPPKEDGQIDDQIRLKHFDSCKLFSTAILFTLTFLTEFPDLTIGLDGSNDVRANLYHSMFLFDRNYLKKYFITIGVDWYVNYFVIK